MAHVRAAHFNLLSTASCEVATHAVAEFLAIIVRNLRARICTVFMRKYGRSHPPIACVMRAVPAIRSSKPTPTHGGDLRCAAARNCGLPRQLLARMPKGCQPVACRSWGLIGDNERRMGRQPGCPKHRPRGFSRGGLRNNPDVGTLGFAV